MKAKPPVILIRSCRPVDRLRIGSQEIADGLLVASMTRCVEVIVGSVFLKQISQPCPARLASDGKRSQLNQHRRVIRPERTDLRARSISSRTSSVRPLYAASQSSVLPVRPPLIEPLRIDFQLLSDGRCVPTGPRLEQDTGEVAGLTSKRFDFRYRHTYP